jgi:long-chain acyl-CoA synthetase
MRGPRCRGERAAADPACREPDQDLARLWIRKLDLLDHRRLAELLQHRGAICILPSFLGRRSGVTLCQDRAPMSANTIGRMVLESTERHSGAAIRFPRDGTWHEWSFAELGTAVRELARRLAALGLEPGDRVALLGETRPEWTLADAALLAAGLVVVPVYHTNSPEECRYVVDHSGARAIILEDAGQLAKIEAVRRELPGLEHVISMVPAGDTTTVADLRTRADETPEAELQRRLDAVDPDDVATIVYTSGTTGPPKGCMLTHRSVLFTGEAYVETVDLRPPATLFMFLPLAHALARVVQMVSIQIGGTLAFWSGDSRRLVEDVGAARPTHFPSVPRVFEKIHARVLARGEEGSAVKQRLFAWAIATGRKARPAMRKGTASAALKAQYAVADRLVLSKVRDLVGGRLELALTGAAPIPGEVLEFLDACGITVLEGYGMTESCAAATLNPPHDPRFGTVGPALPGTGVRIADDGEILLSGPNVFKGYHRNEEATREVFEGDAVRTGDLGELEDGYLRITGRKKDLIITSSGKNISPTNIENALRESRWISQAVVHGDNRSYLVAVLTLDADEAPALAAELGIDGDVAAMASDPRVREVLQRDVDAANARFARIEQVKKFTVLEQDLSQDAGELTPTMKVKRAVVEKRYADTFEALYAG